MQGRGDRKYMHFFELGRVSVLGKLRILLYINLCTVTHTAVSVRVIVAIPPGSFTPSSSYSRNPAE